MKAETRKFKNLAEAESQLGLDAHRVSTWTSHLLHEGQKRSILLLSTGSGGTQQLQYWAEDDLIGLARAILWVFDSPKEEAIVESLGRIEDKIENLTNALPNYEDIHQYIDRLADRLSGRPLHSVEDDG